MTSPSKFRHLSPRRQRIAITRRVGQAVIRAMAPHDPVALFSAEIGDAMRYVEQVTGKVATLRTPRSVSFDRYTCLRATWKLSTEPGKWVAMEYVDRGQR